MAPRVLHVRVERIPVGEPDQVHLVGQRGIPAGERRPRATRGNRGSSATATMRLRRRPRVQRWTGRRVQRTRADRHALESATPNERNSTMYRAHHFRRPAAVLSPAFDNARCHDHRTQSADVSWLGVRCAARSAPRFFVNRSATSSSCPVPTSGLGADPSFRGSDRGPVIDRAILNAQYGGLAGGSSDSRRHWRQVPGAGDAPRRRVHSTRRRVGARQRLRSADDGHQTVRLDQLAVVEPRSVSGHDATAMRRVTHMANRSEGCGPNAGTTRSGSPSATRR